MIELDEEQREVVESDNSMICIAGPGSGKTRVLTEKARRLFNSGQNILCLCFTRSAAREMSSRVPGIPATTIHSYCCGRVGWKEEWGYTGLLYRFLIDTDSDKFDWVLVDEVQDLNEMELDVVLSLVGNRLFAVGDPYQSIYGFQGAMGPSIISRLGKAGCKEVALHNNYRSCPEIVSKLNRWFRRDLVSVGVKDTGLTAILCRRNDDVFEVSRFLKKEEVAHRVRLSAQVGGDNREYDVIGESTLRLNTIHVAKGHEFDKVLLYSWFPDNYDEEERVYYVAMSRASKEFLSIRNLKELSGALRESPTRSSLPVSSPSDMP